MGATVIQHISQGVAPLTAVLLKQALAWCRRRNSRKHRNTGLWPVRQAGILPAFPGFAASAKFRESVLECASPLALLRSLSPDSSLHASSFVRSDRSLLHIRNLYDAAFCLRIFRILYYSHVQFFLAFAEGDVCCAIPRGDRK
jgi:hypothetical protein